MGIRSASLRRQINVVMAPDFLRTILYTKGTSSSTNKDWNTILDKKLNFGSFKGLQHMNGNVFLIVCSGGHVFLTRCGVLNYMFLLKLNYYTTIITPNVQNNTKKTDNKILSNNYYIFIKKFGAKNCCKCIMNNSDPQVGDCGDNMGLQIDICSNFDNNSYVVKNKSNDLVVDANLFNNLTDGFSNDFSQMEEEILKVLKTMPDIGKESNLFADVNNLDPINAIGTDGVDSQQILEISGSLSNFESAFLGDVRAAMEINDDDSHHQIEIENSPSSPLLPDNEPEISYEEKHSDKMAQLLTIERRIDRCARRLRIKQSKLLSSHVKEQVFGLQDASNDAARHHPTKSFIDKYITRVHSYSGPPSTGSQSSPNPLAPPSNQYLGSESGDNSSSRFTSASPSIASDVNNEEVGKVIGNLRLQADTLQRDFDDECTASSSGNDSLDEESIPFVNQEEERILKIPLKKRAAWKWLHERAGAAYKTAWLQSQILDLEYKIHQYTEVYRRLRNGKSKVVFRSNSTTTAAASEQTAEILQNGRSPVVNGYHGGGGSSLFGSTSLKLSKIEFDDNAVAADCDSSRTRPFFKNKFQNRRILNLDDNSNNNININSSNSSDLNHSSCLKIKVKSRNRIRRRLNDESAFSLLPTANKYAFVDPAYHPVLSNYSDISVSTHISGETKKSELWDRMLKDAGTKRSDATISDSYKKKGGKSNKRKLYEEQGEGNVKNVSYKKSKRKRRKLFRLSDSDLEDDDFMMADDEIVDKKDDIYNSQPGSPYSSHSSNANKDGSNRRRNQSSYDIDNFIIPPSTIQTPLIKKPKYKEISIPTWRIVEDDELDVTIIDRSSVLPEVLEDLDYDVSKVHGLLEAAEKIKFRIQPQHPGQQSRRRRVDSGPEIMHNTVNGDRGTPTPDTMIIDAAVTVPSPTDNSTSVMSVFEGGAGGGGIIEDSNISLKRNRNVSVSAVGDSKMFFSSMLTPDYSDINMEPMVIPKIVAPFDRRVFPLPVEDYQAMVQEQHEFDTAIKATQFLQTATDAADPLLSTVNRSAVQSPISESTESILLDDCSNNDQDWNQDLDETELMVNRT